MSLTIFVTSAGSVSEVFGQHLEVVLAFNDKIVHFKEVSLCGVALVAQALGLALELCQNLLFFPSTV